MLPGEELFVLFYILWVNVSLGPVGKVDLLSDAWDVFHLLLEGLCIFKLELLINLAIFSLWGQFCLINIHLLNPCLFGLFILFKTEVDIGIWKFDKVEIEL